MKKILLISLSIFLLILVGGGLWAYQYFLAPDPEVTKQLEEEFSKEFFDFSDFEIELDDEEPIAVDVATNQDAKEEAASNQPSASQPERPVDSTQDNPGKPAENITEEALVEKYTPRFKKLEAAAVERLDVLFSTGYQEYKQSSSSEKNASTSELAKKYMQAASLLEDGVDSKFRELLAQLEAELKQHNLSLAPIKQAEAEYNQAIKEKKSELLSKIR